MKKIISIILQLFIITVSLYSITINEILEIVEDRSLKYDEVVEILNTLKGQEIFNRYVETGDIVTIDDNCELCNSKVEVFTFVVENNKFIFVFKCNKCRLVVIGIGYYEEINMSTEKVFKPIFFGILSKEDFEEITKIKNKVSYEEAVNIIKDFYSNLTNSYRVTKECSLCKNKTLRIVGNIELYNKFDDNNFYGTTILTCKNEKCKFFSLFKKNSETNFIECLYHGKYNKLEDVWLENQK